MNFLGCFLCELVLHPSVLTARGQKPVNATFLGRAIKGYDPVVYFTDGQQAKGASNYSFESNGADWRFFTVAHRGLFNADPAKYSPHYTGYFVWAVSKGCKAAIDLGARGIASSPVYPNYYM